MAWYAENISYPPHKAQGPEEGVGVEKLLEQKAVYRYSISWIQQGSCTLDLMVMVMYKKVGR